MNNKNAGEYIPKLSGFEIGAGLPVDRRLILSKDQMKYLDFSGTPDLIEPFAMPEQYFVICSDDSCLYLYDENNENLEDTGKFRKLASANLADPFTLQAGENITLVNKGNNKFEISSTGGGQGGDVNWEDIKGGDPNNAYDLANYVSAFIDSKYTSVEREKLAGIEPGAQVNAINGVSNEFEFTGNKQLGIFEVNKDKITGLANALDEKVDKVADMGLSKNDFSDVYKNKLNGIADGAEVNVQADWNQETSTADDFIKNKPDVVLRDEYDAAILDLQENKIDENRANDIASEVTSIAINAINFTKQAEKAGLVKKLVQANGAITELELEEVEFPEPLPVQTGYDPEDGTNPISGMGVKAALDTLPSPMVFRGTLGDNGTVQALPEIATAGDTYKVITAGTYAGKAAKIGDMFIARMVENAGALDWELVPSGDEPSGTVTNVATGEGLTGGPITSSGTIDLSAATKASLAKADAAPTKVKFGGTDYSVSDNMITIEGSHRIYSGQSVPTSITGQRNGDIYILY